MNKKIVLLMGVILFLLTGCYDYKEINTISILSATEITKIDDDYVVYAQVVNPQAPDKTSNAQSPFIIYTGVGKTIQEAYRNISNESLKFLYGNHLQIIIINEKIVQDDIREIVDFYARNPAIRTEFYVLVGKSDNILNVITPIDDLSSASIKESIENNLNYLGTTGETTFNDLINMIEDKNLEIVLPSIKIIDDSDDGDDSKDDGDSVLNIQSSMVDTKYVLDGFAIFKDMQLVGYLDQEKSKIYNLVNNNIKNTIITCKCGDGNYLSVEIIDSDSKVDVNDKRVSIKIKLSANLNEYNCLDSINGVKDFDDVEKDIENHLDNIITNNIYEIIDKYDSDIFGFLNNIYKNDYKLYNKINDRWYSDIYQDLDVFVDVDLNIIAKGNIMGVIDEKN